MPELWMPGVRQMPGRGRSFSGTPGHFANWHSTENDPNAEASALASYLIGKHYEPHFVWNPWTGELVQLLPVNTAGSVLLSGNVDGQVNIGIEAIGRAGTVGMRPFYDSPMKGFGPLLNFLRSWGIPNVWPAGAPLAYPQAYGISNPQRAFWGQSGHYGHSQWPHNEHGDPGLTKIELWGVATPAADVNRFAGYPTLQLGAADTKATSTFPDPTAPVQTLQNAINIADGTEVTGKLSSDGDFGPATKSRVLAFQTKYKLTSDGVAGAQTWAKLDKVLDGKKR